MGLFGARVSNEIGQFRATNPRNGTEVRQGRLDFAELDTRDGRGVESGSSSQAHLPETGRLSSCPASFADSHDRQYQAQMTSRQCSCGKSAPCITILGMDDTCQIGERVKALRLEKGLTQERLAVAADISTSTVTRLERGEKDPDTKTLCALAKVLGVYAAELLGEYVPRMPEPYKSLVKFFEEHPLLPVTEEERGWMLSHRFPGDYDVGDKDYWMAQLILFRQQVRASIAMRMHVAPSQDSQQNK